MQLRKMVLLIVLLPILPAATDAADNMNCYPKAQALNASQARTLTKNTRQRVGAHQTKQLCLLVPKSDTISYLGCERTETPRQRALRRAFLCDIGTPCFEGGVFKNVTRTNSGDQRFDRLCADFENKLDGNQDVRFAYRRAMTYPLSYHQEQNIDKHQLGWIDLKIDAEGKGELIHSWSNGKRNSGNNFYSVVVFRDKDNKSIYTDSQEKSIDAPWFRRAREGQKTSSVKLTQKQMENLDHIDLNMGVRNCGSYLSKINLAGKECAIGVDFKTHKCGAPNPPIEVTFNDKCDGSKED